MSIGITTKFPALPVSTLKPTGFLNFRVEPPFLTSVGAPDSFGGEAFKPGKRAHFIFLFAALAAGFYVGKALGQSPKFIARSLLWKR